MKYGIIYITRDGEKVVSMLGLNDANYERDQREAKSKGSIRWQEQNLSDAQEKILSLEAPRQASGQRGFNPQNLDCIIKKLNKAAVNPDAGARK